MRPGKEKTVLANMWFLKWFYLVTWKGINVKDSNMYIKVQVLKGVQHGKWQVRARHHRASININTIFKDRKHESLIYLREACPPNFESVFGVRERCIKKQTKIK